jgi:transcription-repair coupling factor (superfamily II helicase)
LCAPFLILPKQEITIAELSEFREKCIDRVSSLVEQLPGDQLIVPDELEEQFEHLRYQIQDLTEKLNRKNQSSLIDVSHILPDVEAVEKIQETVDQLHSQLESFEYEEQQQHLSLQKSLIYETSKLF